MQLVLPLMWQSVTFKELSVLRNVDTRAEAENIPFWSFPHASTHGLLAVKILVLYTDSRI